MWTELFANASLSTTTHYQNDQDETGTALLDDKPLNSLESVLNRHLPELEQKSRNILRSYERRKPPTEQTYEDSKTLLRAMGVPYLECPAPFEGEAMAASLVKHGLADYVASEDMDVLSL